MKPDPYFNDIPWEIITDDKGRVIGEVYTLRPVPPQKGGRQGKYVRNDKYSNFKSQRKRGAP